MCTSQIYFHLRPLLLEDSWIASLLNGIGDAISSGLSSVWENISGTLWEAFVKFVLGAVNALVGYVITQISNLSIQIFSLTVVEALLTFFKQLGWALFIAGAVLAVFDICIEYQSMGRFNIKRQLLPMLTGLLAVNLFTALPVALYRFAIDQQDGLMKMLLRLSVGSGSWVNVQTNVAQQIFNLAKGSSFSLGTGLFSIILLIFYIYCIVKVFFANIKRGGILLTMIGVGSLYMVSIPRGYTDGFWGWSKQVAALCVTAVMQNVLLYLGCIVAGNTSALLGIGIMLAANEVPRIAGHFGLDTSTKAGMTSVVYSANAAMSSIRAGSEIIKAASKAAS